ncbi:MAG: sodium/proton-translocating pyrophosphatase, partial [Chloroflexi bacterium]|nr:sodium/proton-translocating pyrophosphatase [Chloroflexota bacterium]
MGWEIVAMVFGALSVGVAVYLWFWTMKQANENPVMKAFSEAVQEGAAAYLKRLFEALGLLAGVIAVILLITLGWEKAVAYVFGAACSAAAGYVGMTVATRANARVAWAARGGLQKAFPVGFNAGAVMGFAMVGVALIGMTIIYMIFGRPDVVLGFSFGASSLALLAKAGGGICTKTADIGADLVGKVEFNLAEDDPRNPAVIADNVGDNVGDVAGMGADIFDSYVASVVAVMVLGYELYSKQANGIDYIVLPLVLGAAGVVASLFGMLFVRTGENNDPGRGLNMGTYATTGIFALLTLGVVFMMGFEQPLGIFWPAFAGLLAGMVIGITSDRFTDIDQRAVQHTAHSAKTGPALLILDGFSYGLLSIVPSVLGICIAMVASWFLAQHYGLAGTYGVSLAAVGMLSVTGMVVSSDAYGPIVDNAKGCAEAGHE